MKNSKYSKKAKSFLDGLQQYKDGGMQIPLPEYQNGVLAPMAPDPNFLNYDPSLIQGPELFAYPNQNPLSIQPPMAINPPVQKQAPTQKPNFNAIPVIGSAITLGLGVKEGIESYQAKQRADILRGYYDQDLAERKRDISLGEYVNTPYSQYQDGGIKIGERVSNFRATDSSQSGTTTGATKMEQAKLSAAQQVENQRILAERKARMGRSKAAKGKPLSAQQIADESAAIGDKFRIFPDDPNSIVDALNPLVMIGDMAAGLGQVPLNIQEGNYGQAAMNVAAPLVTGALLGGKNAAQAANNLINPLAGTGEFLTRQASLKNAYKLNPKNLKSESGLDWMKQWYNDPEFIERYSDTGMFDPVNMQELIVDQLQQYQPKNYLDLLKDKGIKEYLNFGPTTGGLSYGNPENIYINRAMYPFNKKGLESVRAHELTHLIERNGQLLGRADEKELLKPFIDANNIPKNPGFFRREILGDKPEYFLDPTEIHARMNQARFELGLSPKDKFTEQMYDKIKKQKNWFGMGRYIKDKKTFIDLMNKFWMAPATFIVAGDGELPKAKEGGIHIDPKNKGKFTLEAKRRGMGVQEFANKVMANKEDYSPLLVKRANFAKNAAKWEDGGMYSSVSSDHNTTVELANQRKEQAMELLQKMEEVVQLHKMMYGGEMEEFKGGGEMIKRADGSYSRRGLWDNLRANKGSGKKPTKEMLKQERKIRSEEMKEGGELIKRADGSYSRRGLWDNIRANKGSGKEPTKEMLEQERKIKREEMEYGGYMPFMDAMDENNQYMDLPEFGSGGYKVERSSDRKGKTHKVTGPDGSVKYFGDPNMGERSKSKYGKDAFYARHKSNLANNPHFRAYARATWQNGGQFGQIGQTGQIGLEGFGQMYDNQQAYNQNTQRQFEEYYNNLNQQNVANWKNMKASAVNNIVSGIGGLASAGMGMQNGGEYDPTMDVNSTQFDANAFLGREEGQPSELDALIQAEQARQMQRNEVDMELMNFINEGADTSQANYSNLGMFANNASPSSSSNPLAGAGEFSNVIDEIRYRESRGNYGRVNDVSKTTGAYQFMPIWWADQIQDFMGIDPSASQEEVMEAFRTNPQAQDAFMVHVVNNIYKPQLPKLRPYAQKYGLNDEQLIKLMHYRGIGDAIKRLKTGDFAVSEKEKKIYNNPDVMEYLKGPLPK